MFDSRNFYTVFEKDFRTKEGDASVDGFEEIKCIPHKGLLRMLEGMAVTLPENPCFVRTDKLRDFRMTLHIAESMETRADFTFHFYFRFDPSSGNGGVLCIENDGRNMLCSIGVCEKNRTSYVSEMKWYLKDARKLEILVSGNELDLCGKKFQIPENVPEKGRIGFRHLNRAHRYEPLMIQYLKVDSPDRCKEKVSMCSVRFPRHTFYTMSDWNYHFSICRSKNVSRISSVLSGGPVYAKNRNTFYTKHPANELLEKPYFRIVYPDGSTGEKQYIYYGSIGFCEDWATRQPALPKADTQCPVKQDFYFPPLPEDIKILLGFEHYNREDCQNLPKGGCEMLFDPCTGKILTSRKIQHESFHIQLDSGCDKKIVKMIPENIPMYEEAKSFAIHNHYFFEDEKCVFTIKGDLPEKYCSPEELSFRITLEDVFREEIKPSFILQYLTVEKGAFPGEKTIQAEVDLATLPVGVYHLKVEMLMGDKVLHFVRRAFEVMPEKEGDLSAPMKSGLPFLLSAQTDFETDSNSFDPRSEEDVDLSHYFSCSGMHVLPAEERREWELLKYYKRDLFTWILERSTPTPTVKDHLEISRNSKYLAPGTWRFLVNQLSAYSGKYKEKLHRFLLEKGELDIPEEVKNTTETISIEFLEKFLKKYAYSWAVFIAEARNQEKKEIFENYAEMGIDLSTMCNYSCAPFYVTHTGTAFTALRYGWDLRNMDISEYRSFSLAEDYPYLCGYPLTCTPFAMANLKLDVPQMRLFPELFGICGIPQDHATISGNPPLGVMKTGIKRKRFFDAKYRTSYYKDGKFHYWNDDGFHVRNPSMEDMDNLLESWKIIRKMKAARPLKSMGIVGGAECILKHAPRVEKRQEPHWPEAQLDLFSTAEDFPAWVWNHSRLNGLPNPFALRSCDIKNLKPEDLSTLVLPPMDCFTPEEISAIRALYEKGVNLLCSENAAGLEDIFGVEKCGETHHVNSIEGEVTSSPCNMVNYSPLPGTDILLSDADNIPLLTLKNGENGCGKAAFFTFAPTAFQRVKGTAFESYSKCLNKVLLELSRILDEENAPVKLSCGRLTAFMDERNILSLVVMEDAHPHKGEKITPLLTLKGDYRNYRIESDADYSLVSSGEKQTLIRLTLDVDEVRYFRFLSK